MNRNEITEQIVVARLARGLTWQELADAIDRPVMWTTSALLGQHPIPAELGKVLVKMLGLDDSAVPVLAAPPMRGGLPTRGPYRPDHLPLLRSASGVRRGHQRADPRAFGDGIMSAINFSLDLQKKPHPSGDRVVVTFNREIPSLPMGFGGELGRAVSTGREVVMAADRSAKQERKPADVVLSGGGVKFIGLVGAIVALMDAGYSFKRVSGVSAGSVVAAILAAVSKGDQLTSEEVKELALSVPLRKWRDAGPVPYLGAAWGLLRDTSMYRGDVAYDWIRSELKNLGVTTFGDLALDADCLLEGRRTSWWSLLLT